MPDYDFVLWNFDRFPKNASAWVSHAADCQKYAFAADYIRLYALYHYGGIYLDMDVEVLKPFDPLLHLHSMICRQNGADGLEMATIGAQRGEPWLKACLNHYDTHTFVCADGTLDTTPLPNIAETTLLANGYTLVDCLSIADAEETEKRADTKLLPVFDSRFFSPRPYNDKRMHITPDTFSIHHFAGTWLPWYSRLKRSIYFALRLKNS